MNRRFAQGKALAQRFSALVYLVLVCGLLVSCSSQNEEAIDPVLAANCERILYNLETMHDLPEIFRYSDVAGDDTVPILLGEKTRDSAEAKILELFPFLDQLITGKSRDEKQSDLELLYASSIFLFEEALAGTDVEIPYSPAEIEAIALNPNGWDEHVSPLATQIFGESWPPENPQGCAVFDQSAENQNRDSNSSLTFNWATQDYVAFAEFLQAIRNCKVSGWHKGDKCAKNDYVSEPDDYTPSDYVSEEERQILEERERKAEQKAPEESNSSETVNVLPNTICGAVGKVVQTENYGKLTCRFVLVNKIRALIWLK